MVRAPTRIPRPRTWLAVIGVVLLSVLLRPGATSVGPVLAEVSHDLGLSPTLSGLVTALPGLCFAVFGALAVSVAVRLGLNAAIAAGTAAVAAGLLARTFAGDTVSFLLCSVLAFGGMALGNVLVPAFVKRYFPHRPATLMAIYTTGLALGAMLGAAAAAPLEHALPGGWRASLGVWGLLGVVTLVPWLVLARLGRGHPSATHHAASTAGTGSTWDLFRSPKAVALALFFGSQSMQAYVQFGWLAQMLRDGGLSQTAAGLALALITFLGVPAGMIMPVLVGRLPSFRWAPVAMGALLTAGYLGVLLAPTAAPWLWAVLLGLSGAAFPTALALITARTREHHVTARVSAFTQSVGYILAAGGPFLIGALFEATGGWTVPLLLLTASSVLMAGAGAVAAGPGYVDDELARSAMSRPSRSN